jgi:gas vesicle protein
MKQAFKYTGWALVGGAVGATVAYLTAPASGQETRRRISRRIEDEKDELITKGQRAVTHAADFLEGRLKEGKRKLAHVVAR